MTGRSLWSHKNTVLLLAVWLAGVGCRREGVAVYEVAKETPPPGQPAQGHAAMGAADALPGLQWRTPEGWQQLPRSGMSLVRFTAPGKGGADADVAVLALPGVAGKDLEVVNIFRERLQLPPLDQAGLSAITRTVSIGGSEGPLYDMVAPVVGTNSRPRMVVAVLNQGAAGWYFRLSGDSLVVEQQMPAYFEFLKSITLERGTIGAVGAPSDQSALAAAGSPGEPRTGKPVWEVPTGWRELPATSMVIARFGLGAGGGQGEVTVSVFPGDVGGLVANINRWRGQIGLGALGETEARQEAKPLDVRGTEAKLVDMAGQRDGKKVRLVGVILPQGSQTWFYKLVGDETLAAQEKENLVKFARSAH